MLSYEDVKHCLYLFQHLKAQITEKSVFYVFVPSYPGKSQITNNQHRLSFCNDARSVKTNELMLIKIYAMIALARSIYPLSSNMFDSQFTIPLCAQLQVTRPSRKTSKLSENLQVEYFSDIKLKLTSKGAKLGCKCLYQLPNLVLNAVKYNDISSSVLQFVLVEFFLLRISQGKILMRIKKYIDMFNSKSLNIYQKVQLCLQKVKDIKSGQIQQNVIFNMNQQVVFNALAV